MDITLQIVNVPQEIIDILEESGKRGLSQLVNAGYAHPDVLKGDYVFKQCIVDFDALQFIDNPCFPHEFITKIVSAINAIKIKAIDDQKRSEALN